MRRRYDVVVVGARIAGAATARALARRGVRVCLIDRARFPSDTLSTHTIHGIEPVRQVGLLPGLLRTGAPLLDRSSVTVDGLDLSVSHPEAPSLSVRRPLMDAAMLELALDAGVELREQTGLMGLLWKGRRVVGARVSTPGRGVEDLLTDVVVGADGRGSSVAKFTGARRYNVTRGERASLWCYYEGGQWPDVLQFHRLGDDILMGVPADSGRFLAAVACAPERASRYRAEPLRVLDREFRGSPHVGELLTGARQLPELYRVLRFTCYYRESAGRGWALVGDAGHFKDPTVGQGINDALRQSERLGADVVAALGHGGLDGRLRRYWRWRDREARAMYWFSQDLGKGGPVDPVVRALLTRLVEAGEADLLREIIVRLRRPTALRTPARLARAAAAVLSDGPDLAAAARELGRGVALELSRVRLDLRPRYEEREPGRRPLTAGPADLTVLQGPDRPAVGTRL